MSLLKGKSGLGLGTKLGASLGTSQSELNSYLSSLKKKQTEVNKKHGKDETAEDHPEDADDVFAITEEDSDLASLALEFAKDEIKDSPFLKRKEDRRLSTASSVGTPLPEKDAPFINSLVKVKAKPNHSSAALANFMKYDAKYGPKGFQKPEESDSEELMSDLQSPLRIASELEERIRPTSRGSSRRSSLLRKDSDASMGRPRSRKASVEVDQFKGSNQQRSLQGNLSERLKQHADAKNLKVIMPPPRSRKVSGDSAGGNKTPLLSASEVSELPLGSPSPSPRSPMVLEELHDIEELAEVEEEVAQIKEPIVEVEKKTLESGDDATLIEVKKLEKDQTDKAKPDAPNLEDQITGLEHVRKKTRQPRHKRSSSSEDPSSRQSRSRRHRHSKSSHCYYCDHMCDFHRSHVMNNWVGTGNDNSNYKGRKKRHSSKPPRHDEGVQVGPPSVIGASDHYLFDPTLDLLFTRRNLSDEIHQNESLRQRLLHPRKHINQAVSEFASTNPGQGLISELMKSQLEITRNFLQCQRDLYISFCETLQSSVQVSTSKSKVVHSKVKSPKESKTEKDDEPKIDEVSYQSDFEPEDESL
ncbi:uncharacterized protein LOC131876984 isoform X2 [Tigriopus californicus]|uniref:uncharacterized protein LOC131876984 isoform X2 n=1 Tax=Tigriopus californicus TaxID=6832 RepID=UPI0027DA1482|nr:uncharacterized protein LOC131876984 isoform X2 [Tigriopus californicus]